jgi:tetratricopeptide (TPR) repeat protein
MFLANRNAAIDSTSEGRDRAYRLYQAGDAAAAEEICRHLLEVDPLHAEAVYLLAVIALESGHADESYTLFEQAALIAPFNHVFVNALGEAHQTRGHTTDAMACFRQAIALRPVYARSHNNLGLLQNRKQRLSFDISHPTTKTATGRLRVGYLSGDFCDHPISHLLHGFFGRHDRQRFESFAYSFGPEDDSLVRRRISAECEHFVDVSLLSYPDIARRIAADGIHILVDLMGHTWVNRLGAIAM